MQTRRDLPSGVTGVRRIEDPHQRVAPRDQGHIAIHGLASDHQAALDALVDRHFLNANALSRVRRRAGAATTSHAARRGATRRAALSSRGLVVSAAAVRRTTDAPKHAQRDEPNQSPAIHGQVLSA